MHMPRVAGAFRKAGFVEKWIPSAKGLVDSNVHLCSRFHQRSATERIQTRRSASPLTPNSLAIPRHFGVADAGDRPAGK